MRDELERVEFARRIRLLHFSDCKEEENQNEYDEGLNAGPSGSKEDRYEDHGYFTKHHYTFPVVGTMFVTFIEKSITL